MHAIASRQQQAGHEVHIVTATPAVVLTSSGSDSEFSSAGVRIHRVVMKVPFDLPVHLHTRARVVDVFKAISPDVVHIHLGAVSPFAWGAARAAHQCNVPVLVTVHSMWGALARAGYRLSNLIMRWSKWNVTWSAVSVTAASAVAGALPRAQRPVLVLANGIDVNEWHLPEPAPGTSHEQGPVQLVTVMRLAPRKRLLPLLRIIERVQGNAEIHLIVIGDGPARTRGQRFARNLPVTFVGRLTAQEIRTVFQDADVFIQPSIRESFGIAALEARTAGLPVIARAQTGSTGFVEDGINGVLAQSDSEMAEAVVRLANDPSVRRRMAHWNREHPPVQEWGSVLAAAVDAYGLAMRKSPK